MTDPDGDSDPLLGIREIGARLRISHIDARRMCQDGRIPAAKVGACWFVASSKLPPPGELVGLDVREMARRLDLSIAKVRAV